MHFEILRFSDLPRSRTPRWLLAAGRGLRRPLQQPRLAGRVGAGDECGGGRCPTHPGRPRSRPAGRPAPAGRAPRRWSGQAEVAPDAVPTVLAAEAAAGRGAEPAGRGHRPGRRRRPGAAPAPGPGPGHREVVGRVAPGRPTPPSAGRPVTAWLWSRAAGTSTAAASLGMNVRSSGWPSGWFRSGGDRRRVRPGHGASVLDGYEAYAAIYDRLETAHAAVDAYPGAGGLRRRPRWAGRGCTCSGSTANRAAAEVWFRLGQVATSLGRPTTSACAALGPGSIIAWWAQERLFAEAVPGLIDHLPGYGPQKNQLGPTGHLSGGGGGPPDGRIRGHLPRCDGRSARHASRGEAGPAPRSGGSGAWQRPPVGAGPGRPGPWRSRPARVPPGRAAGPRPVDATVPRRCRRPPESHRDGQGLAAGGHLVAAGRRRTGRAGPPGRHRRSAGGP